MAVLDIALIGAAYLLGSISTAIVTCKLMGLPDPRSGGSGNPGATNVLRLGGKKAAAVTLAGDLLKGLLPVLAAQALSVGAATLALVGLAAFLGHLYPIFFGFKGGKGVATTLGVLLGISWWVGLATAATWLAMAAVFRISSLSALTAMLMAPLYTHLFTHSKELVIGTAVMSAVLYWRHRSNIGRLLRGEEGRMGKRRESQSSN
ncbi:MAG: acyl-phosphate glycerol 3-phosphate acyltransferase [Thiotrichales bacterium SG8_50]|nr:MAG: acyl-phosphate glycerol 3-phosphate acyltransferase [Thiotrichales bacterium SG8_50]